MFFVIVETEKNDAIIGLLYEYLLTNNAIIYSHVLKKIIASTKKKENFKKMPNKFGWNNTFYLQSVNSFCDCSKTMPSK